MIYNVFGLMSTLTSTSKCEKNFQKHGFSSCLMYRATTPRCNWHMFMYRLSTLCWVSFPPACSYPISCQDTFNCLFSETRRKKATVTVTVVFYKEDAFQPVCRELLTRQMLITQTEQQICSEIIYIFIFFKQEKIIIVTTTCHPYIWT